MKGLSGLRPRHFEVIKKQVLKTYFFLISFIYQLRFSHAFIKTRSFFNFYFHVLWWYFLNRCLRNECRFGLGVNVWAFSYRAFEVLIWLWPGPIVKLSIIDCSFRRYIRARKPSRSTPIGFREFLSLLGSISRSPFQKPKSNFEKVSEIGRAFSGIFRWKSEKSEQLIKPKKTIIFILNGLIGNLCFEFFFFGFDKNKLDSLGIYKSCYVHVTIIRLEILISLENITFSVFPLCAHVT